MSDHCTHGVVETHDQGWRMVTRCCWCGHVLSIKELPRNLRAAERADRFRTLRAAYHARAWK